MLCLETNWTAQIVFLEPVLDNNHLVLNVSQNRNKMNYVYTNGSQKVHLDQLGTSTVSRA